MMSRKMMMTATVVIALVVVVLFGTRRAINISFLALVWWKLEWWCAPRWMTAAVEMATPGRMEEAEPSSGLTDTSRCATRYDTEKGKWLQQQQQDDEEEPAGEGEQQESRRWRRQQRQQQQQSRHHQHRQQTVTPSPPKATQGYRLQKRSSHPKFLVEQYYSRQLDAECRSAGQPQVLHRQKIAPAPIARAARPLLTPVSLASAVTATSARREIVLAGARAAGGRDGETIEGKSYRDLRPAEDVQEQHKKRGTDLSLPFNLRLGTGDPPWRTTTGEPAVASSRAPVFRIDNGGYNRASQAPPGLDTAGAVRDTVSAVAAAAAPSAASRQGLRRGGSRPPAYSAVTKDTAGTGKDCASSKKQRSSTPARRGQQVSMTRPPSSAKAASGTSGVPSNVAGEYRVDEAKKWLLLNGVTSWKVEQQVASHRGPRALSLLGQVVWRSPRLPAASPSEVMPLCLPAGGHLGTRRHPVWCHLPPSLMAVLPLPAGRRASALRPPRAASSWPSVVPGVQFRFSSNGVEEELTAERCLVDLSVPGVAKPTVCPAPAVLDSGARVSTIPESVVRRLEVANPDVQIVHAMDPVPALLVADGRDLRVMQKTCPEATARAGHKARVTGVESPDVQEARRVTLSVDAIQPVDREEVPDEAVEHLAACGPETVMSPSQEETGREAALTAAVESVSTAGLSGNEFAKLRAIVDRRYSAFCRASRGDLTANVEPMW
eukprot:g16694.t2